jgi:hypothetical protein
MGALVHDPRKDAGLAKLRDQRQFDRIKRRTVASCRSCVDMIGAWAWCPRQDDNHMSIYGPRNNRCNRRLGTLVAEPAWGLNWGPHPYLLENNLIDQ